jgi:hypothetical protein
MAVRRLAHPLVIFALMCGAALAAAAGPTVETAYDVSQVEIGEDGVYSKVAIEGTRTVKTPGAPALPVEYLSFVIPADMRVEDVVASWLEEEELPGTHRVIPAQREVPTGESAEWVDPDPSIYGSESVYPTERVVYLGDGYLGGYRIATVAIYPLAYAPATGKLTLARDVSIALELTPSPDRSQPRHRMTARSDELYRSLVESIVVNKGDVAGKLRGVEVVHDVGTDEGFLPRYSPSLDGSPVEYVIVTSDEFAPQFQELADWKTKKGVPAVVKTVDWIEENYPGGCDTAERIRFFLKDAFASWGTTYVLLGGDTGVVPVRYAWSGYYGGWDISTDLYYSDLDGNWNGDGDDQFGEAYVSIASPGDSTDLYPDVIVGRAPVATVLEVETFIDKTLAYEKTANDLFANRILFMAEVLFPYDWEPGQFISTDGAGHIVEDVISLVPPEVHCLRLYQNYMAFPGSYPLTKQSAIDSLNHGYNIVSHVGHGNKDVLRTSLGNYISIQDVDGFSNGIDKCGFMWMLNCSSTKIEVDCIAEHFLNNPGGGASSLYGPTRFAFPTTVEDYFFEWFERLYVSGERKAGVLCAESKLPHIPGSFYDNTDRWTQLSFVYLGDPELDLWVDRPTDLTVVHDASITLGPTDFAISVSDPAAVEGAIVAVIKEDEVYATGVTDAGGQATLSFTPKTTGTMTITVTAEDHYAYEDVIGVASSAGPHLTLRSVSVDDDASGWSDGNGNGRAEAGEAIELDVTVGNGGQSGAANVTATLVDGDAYVTIVDGSHYLNTLPPLTEVSYQDAFLVMISDDCPNEYEVPITLEMSDGARTFWYDEFTLTIYRPELVQASNDVDDGIGGNGIPGVGETIILTVDVLNDGNGVADQITGVLRYPGAAVTIHDSTDVWGDIGAGEIVSGQSGFEFDVDAPITGPFQLVLTDGDGKQWSHWFDLVRPGALSDLAGTTKGSTISLTWVRSEELDLWGYNVYRTDHPAGTYELANDGVVERTSYFQDAGLLDNTRYYYRVTAVDSSGNEGQPSAVLEISTNPPSLEGWPLLGGEQIYNTPVMADLDLDGDLEILVGSLDVYCWHHTGIEYMDGDGDPRTNGIFATHGQGGYRSSLAVGEFDGDPTPEIVGACWGEAEIPDDRIFVWNADDGTVLEGWPARTGKFCWATPALGDLSGDGMDDVVISSADGYLYAWKSNGEELIDGDGNPETDGIFTYLSWPYGYQYGSPALANIDEDLDLEIIVPSRCESLFVFNADGTRVPGWPVHCGEPLIGSPAVADLDGDGSPEIIVTANDSGMFVFSATGETLPGWPIAIDIGGDFPPSPAIGDVNGDEIPDIVQPDEDGFIHVLDIGGQELPGWPQPFNVVPSTSITSSSVSIGDVNGDTHADIVVGSNTGQLFAFSGFGDVLNGWPIQTDAEVYGTPTLGDMDLDGDIEVAVGGMDVGVYIWDCDGIYADGEGVDWATFRHNSKRTGNYDFQFPVGIDEGDGAFVRVAALEQNHPNPFNPVTSIGYSVPADIATLELGVYNVSGRLVRTLASGACEPGRHVAVWDGRNERGERVASGIYFVRLSAGTVTESRKMVLLK